MATSAPTAAPAAPPAPPRPAVNPPPAPSATPPAPAATPAAPTAPPDPNPVELQLFRFTKPDDSIFIFARVLDVHDLGMKDQTVTFSSGKHGRDDEETDENGICNYPNTITKTDQDQRLTALVSGIATPAVLHIPAKRIPKTQEQIDQDAKNNRNAKWLIRIVAGLWLVWAALILGFGLGKPLISFSRTTLTEQEKWYNEVPGVKGSPWEAKAEQPANFWKQDWQKPSLLILIALTALSIGYSILALREEVAEALRNGWSKVLDRRGHMAFTKDPALQRWLELVGLLKTARARREVAATPVATPTAPTTPDAATTGVRHRNTFWELFRSDLLSDFITDILPKILSAIFRIKI